MVCIRKIHLYAKKWRAHPDSFYIFGLSLYKFKIVGQITYL